jgi:hypothetical protein
MVKTKTTPLTTLTGRRQPRPRTHQGAPSPILHRLCVDPSPTATFDASISVHKVAYDNLSSLTSPFRGQDAVVSTVGTFGISAQCSAIDAAIAAGVQRFVPSEFGGDTSLGDGGSRRAQ